MSKEINKLGKKKVRKKV